MSRKRREPNRKNLTPVVIRAAVLKAKREGRANLTWDTKARGLALRCAPSGAWSFKFVFGRSGRTRWFTIGPATLADARRQAAKLRVQVLEGKDPQAERTAERGAGTFKELADHYLEYAKKRNRSWPQARALVERLLLPRWGKLKAADIRRGDVKSLMSSIAAPIVGNQTLAAASAIFSFAIREEFGGITVNPCRLVERNATRSRERVLSESELPLFWSAFEKAGVPGAALQLVLLTGSGRAR